VQVGENSYTAPHIVIAVGGEPSRPENTPGSGKTLRTLNIIDFKNFEYYKL
jgi:pyruvate/2-oxoglutarate dehydrogenase complex dihydrolipoamide dehydrogenase (E3) component